MITPYLKYAKVETGIVDAVEEYNGKWRIMVKLEDAHTAEERSQPLAAPIICRPIGVFSGGGVSSEEVNLPEVGARCLVLLDNPENPREGYLLGTIDSALTPKTKQKIRSSQPGNFDVSMSSGSKISISNSSPRTYIGNDRAGVETKEDGTTIKAGPSTVEAKKTYYKISINRDIGGIDPEKTGFFYLGGEGAQLFSRNNITITAPSKTIQLAGGDLNTNFKGPVTIRGASSQQAYGGEYSVSAGAFNFRAASGRTLTGTVPGAGRPISFNVEAFEGHISMSTAFGKMLFHTLNPVGDITIASGQFPLVASATGSMVRTLAGVLDLKSSGLINIAARVGVDFSGSSSVSMLGHLPLAPTPGPFNFIPVCPFGGIPHQAAVTAAAPVDKVPTVLPSPPAYLV